MAYCNPECRPRIYLTEEARKKAEEDERLKRLENISRRKQSGPKSKFGLMEYIVGFIVGKT